VPAYRGDRVLIEGWIIISLVLIAIIVRLIVRWRRDWGWDDYVIIPTMVSFLVRPHAQACFKKARQAENLSCNNCFPAICVWVRSYCSNGDRSQSSCDQNVYDGFDPSWNFVPVVLTSHLELCFGLIAASLPALNSAYMRSIYASFRSKSIPRSMSERKPTFCFLLDILTLTQKIPMHSLNSLPSSFWMVKHREAMPSLDLLRKRK
jgi:hypothetical protein